MSNGTVLMTLDDHNCRNCVRFLLLVQAQLSQKVRDRSSPNFQDGRRWLLWNWVPIAHETLPWQPIFVYSIQKVFRHSDPCVINFVLSATTRSTVVGVMYKVDRRRFPLATPIRRETDTAPPGTNIPPLDISSLDIFQTLACDGIRQEVQVLRWTQAHPLPHQLAIINRRRGWKQGGLQSGFVLHLVIVTQTSIAAMSGSRSNDFMNDNMKVVS